MKSTPRSARGFTLIELMITVAILGVLAAIAIPRYLTYSLNARRTEALLMMGMMRTQQSAYWADYDCFADTEQQPAGVPSGMQRQWVRTPAPSPFVACGVQVSMEAFGLVPAYLVMYYSYRCAARGAGGGLVDDFTCAAQGDLDSNGQLAEYVYCTDHALTGAGIASPISGAPCTITFEQVRTSVAIY